jgi:hypothetical protein
VRRIVSTLLLAIAAISVAGAADRPDEPESRGRLLVETAVLKPGPDGGVIEVRFRLAGVDRLPADPGETYVRDEESGIVSRVRRIPMLPATSSADPEPSKIASFVVPNYGNKFQAGRTVTIVVAGLERGGVLLEAAEPKGGATVVASPEPRPAPSEAKLTVLSLRTTANGDLLDVRYKLTGVERVSGDTKETYVLDPATGERLGALGVSRVGLLSTKHVDKAGTSFLILQNPGKKIKAGDRVTIVISGARADDVLVEP